MTDGTPADPPPEPADDEMQHLRLRARARLFGDADQPGSIGRYAVIGSLGEGGMGVVHLAYDAELDRRVAIKLLRVDSDGGSQGQARLVREAQAMARLSHPNVAHVYEVGRHDDRVFVAMEYVRGVTLRAWQHHHASDWREILALHVQAGRGLAAAHDAGLVHRDYKPENVLVGDDGRARVLDFGLARPDAGTIESPRVPSTLADETVELTRTGTVLGTPAYMAPEQLAGGRVDARADQFAFCVALFEALYGMRPFAGRTVAELAESMSAGTLARVTGNTVPSGVQRVLERGLAHDPNDRFPGMTALLTALEGDATGRRSRAVRWLSSAVAILVLGMVAWSVLPGRRAPLGLATVLPHEATIEDPWATIVAASRLPPVQPIALPEDPLAVSVHRLRNGLTIYIAPRHDVPRISAIVAVRGGPRVELPGSHGVTNLLQHMLFHGSTRLGTTDWQAERPVLERRDALADELAGTTDPARRAVLMQRIEEAERELALWTVSSEYDTVLRELGATLVNGVTRPDAMLFTVDLPSARLEPWLAMEVDRLREPVFRGFFSELGAIREAIRPSLHGADAGLRALDEMLFDGRPGYWTMLGQPRDLARPMLAEMKAHHRTWFVPNNMAIVLAGDVEPARAVSLIEAAFGDWAPAELPAPLPPLPPIRERMERLVDGVMAVRLWLG